MMSFCQSLTVAEEVFQIQDLIKQSVDEKVIMANNFISMIYFLLVVSHGGSAEEH